MPYTDMNCSRAAFTQRMGWQIFHCQLVDEQGLKAMIYLSNDVMDKDTFRMLCGLWAQRWRKTYSLGVLYAEVPARLIKLADMLVDGPACTKAFIKYLVEQGAGSATATWHRLSLFLDTATDAHRTRQFRPSPRELNNPTMNRCVADSVGILLSAIAIRWKAKKSHTTSALVDEC